MIVLETLEAFNKCIEEMISVADNATEKINKLTSINTFSNDIDAIQEEFNQSIDKIVAKYSKVPELDNPDNPELTKLMEDKMEPALNRFQSAAEKKIKEFTEKINIK